MIKMGQKLIAFVMLMSFLSTSALPVLAAATQSAVTPTSAKKSITIAGTSSLKNGNKRLSVSLRDSDVKQALRMFADKAGLNIIFHDSVEDKKITLDLVGVTLNDAMRMVMQATDLSYFVDGQTMIIMSAEKSKELNITKQNIMVLPVKYADATEIASFLNQNVFAINKPGLSNTEIVSVNPAKNELLIFGTQSDYDMAVKVLTLLDEPTRITHFKVNHVTPKEMAKNICTSLLKSYKEDDTDSEEDDDDDDDDDNEGEEKSSKSGVTAAAIGGTKVELGEAKMACAIGDIQEKDGGQQASGGLYKINKNSMKVLYYETLGLVTVIGGSPDQIETISSFVTATDIKQPMAYIEFSIIELSEEGSKQFNTDWSFVTKTFSMGFNGGVFTVGNESVPIAWAHAPGARPQQENATITSYFRYIVGSKKGKVLANPKVMVTSGKNSVIDLTSDYIKRLVSDTNTGAGVTNTHKTPEIGSDQGIIVSLTPYISRDGYVTMNIAPSYAVEKERVYDPLSDDLLATLLQRRNLELSNIRVKDGDTLVIGGLIQETNSNNVEKMPILGDIPGLGFFFRNTDTQKTKQELVILITPHIIQDSVDLVDNSQNNL